jgi:hypothetical protein
MSKIVQVASSALLVCVALAATPSISATGGWYLLIPLIGPYDEHSQYLQGYKILDTKPLSQWAHQGAYDSASECEAVRDSQTRVAHGYYSKSNQDYISAVGAKTEDSAVLKHMRWTTERANASVDALMASRCIKSDDPRLGK